MKIILIGFMGSGKTTVGHLLAKKLNLKVVDMDDLIVKISKKKSINEIFTKDGETHFRELEIEVGKSMADKKNIIISTSGGVVINKIIIDHLKMNDGKIIFLKTSFLEINKRLKNIKDRPLFKDKKIAKKLFTFRQRLYEEYADIIVDTSNKTVDEVIISLLKKI